MCGSGDDGAKETRLIKTTTTSGTRRQEREEDKHKTHHKLNRPILMELMDRKTTKWDFIRAQVGEAAKKHKTKQRKSVYFPIQWCWSGQVNVLTHIRTLKTHRGPFLFPQIAKKNYFLFNFKPTLEGFSLHLSYLLAPCYPRQEKPIFVDFQGPQDGCSVGGILEDRKRDVKAANIKQNTKTAPGLGNGHLKGLF